MQKKCFILLSVLYCGLFQASDIFKAIESKNQRVIQSWLKYNPDIEMVNDQGQTVLMKAVLAENKSLVRTLLKKGVSVNAIDQFGRTALDYAVELHNKEISKVLVKNQGMVTSEVNAVKCQELVIKKYLRWQKALVLLTGGLILLTVGCFVLATFVATVMLPCDYTSTGAFLGLIVVEIGIGCATCYGVYRWASHAFDKNFEHEICVLP